MGGGLGLTSMCVVRGDVLGLQARDILPPAPNKSHPPSNAKHNQPSYIYIYSPRLAHCFHWPCRGTIVGNNRRLACVSELLNSIPCCLADACGAAALTDCMTEVFECALEIKRKTPPWRRASCLELPRVSDRRRRRRSPVSMNTSEISGV